MEISYPFTSGSGSVVSEANWETMASNYVENGVVYTPGGAILLVQAGSGMGISLGLGAAFINGTYYANTAAIPFTIANNTSGNTRIDTVALTLDTTGNSINSSVVAGTPGASPVPATLTSLQLPLAYVTVGSGVANIYASNIVPCRPFAGPGPVTNWIPFALAVTATPYGGGTFGPTPTVSGTPTALFKVQGDMCTVVVNALVALASGSGPGPTYSMQLPLAATAFSWPGTANVQNSVGHGLTYLSGGISYVQLLNYSHGNLITDSFARYDSLHLSYPIVPQ